MKIFKLFPTAAICFLVAGILFMGCKKTFLDEYNPASRTTDNMYKDPAGYDGLVNSCYPLLRNITQSRNLTVKGTDMMCAGGWSGIFFGQSNQIGNELDQYDIRLNSTTGALQGYWDDLYKEINRCNAAVDRADGVVGLDPAKKAIRVGEAKFLRALSYFWLVQQWGDVPMPLKESLAGKLEASKSASKDIYTQIIADLNSAVTALPASTTDQGRATQGAAKFLLAKVYLTRGWNYNNSLGGSSADFTSSLALCDELIASGLYPLEANWNNLWPTHDKKVTNAQPSIAASVTTANASKEVIFAVQYANPQYYYGDGNNNPATGLIGNNMHSQFGHGPSGVAQAGGATIFYSKLQGDRNYPTWAAYRMFDPTMDSRYEGTFNNVSYATVAQTISLKNNTFSQNLSITYAIGDTTAIILPWNRPLPTGGERGLNVSGGTKKYAVGHISEIVGYAPLTSTTGVVDNMFWASPMFWKFFQPSVPFQDGWSTLNDPIFRSAELYLMAAEAIVKGATGAKLGTADVYYNRILDRALGTANAGKIPNRALNPEKGTDPITNVMSYRATPANITVDMILDESAREFLGEGQRWYDLKRTGTLISRGAKYNPWIGYGLSGTPVIAVKHYLRPIPQSMIDLTLPKIDQNPGY
jgi:hypothetical protein